MNAEAAPVVLRPMREADLDQVLAITASLKDAPHWPRAAYLPALDPGATPRRIALVAEEISGELGVLGGPGEKHTSRAKAQPQSGNLIVRAEALTYHSPLTVQSGDSPSNGEEKGRSVVGFLIACLVTPQAELESNAVSEAVQRQGIGRRLIAALAEELKVAGVREVFLEVRASNVRALGFYRSLGWIESGRRSRYYADPEEDAVLMSLRFE